MVLMVYLGKALKIVLEQKNQKIRINNRLLTKLECYLGIKL